MTVEKDVFNRAVDKLNRIIAREGDAEGVRRNPDYFLQILNETIMETEAGRFFNGK